MTEEKLKELKNEIRQVVEDANLPLLRTVVISGSACLPYIDDPHDVDVALYVDADSCAHPIKYVKGLKEALRERVGSNVSSFTRRIKSDGSWTMDGDYIRRDAFMNHPMFCASAVGDITEIIPPDTVDVLKNKDRYIESLKHWYLSDAFKRARERLGVIKHVYQGLLVVYFIENGSYELTEEQRKNVNIAHDKAEGADELCDWLIEKLKGM